MNKSSIITIKEKCIGCNKCIRVCPIHGANISEKIIEASGKRAEEED